MVWDRTPRRSSSSSIFKAVVVFPDPEGPESRTMGLRGRLARMASAAWLTFSAYWASHSSRNPFTSWSMRRLISCS